MWGRLDYQAAYQAHVTELVDVPGQAHSQDLHGCPLGLNLPFFLGESIRQVLCPIVCILCPPQPINFWQEALDQLVQLVCIDRLSSDV